MGVEDISRHLFEKYYTDVHDVDEDMMAISSYNGAWQAGNASGAALRYMRTGSSHQHDGVASSHENGINYTDHHDVDEDIATIVKHGGHRGDHTSAGLAYRQFRDSPSYHIDHVASRCRHRRVKSLIIRMCMMSTKIARLFRFMVEAGTIQPGQASQNDIYPTVSLIHLTFLLLDVKKAHHLFRDDELVIMN